MRKYSEEEILSSIESEKAFECISPDGGFTLKVEEYIPAIYTAIHNGHNLRANLENSCRLDEGERFYEEDPYTGDLIDAMPITLIANDSRYEYDLNRPIATCIYKKAWGKEVWKKSLPVTQKRVSIEKHKAFYRILDALISKLETKYGACVLFDIHSYNHQRINTETPVFNLGTDQIDLSRWSSVVKRFSESLAQLTIPGQKTTVALNDVFQGKGYLIAHVNGRFENTLVLPCEVKKVFMDESNGAVFPLVLNSMKEGMKRCFSDTAAFFSRRHTRKRHARRLGMLSTFIDLALQQVDRDLYRLAKATETLKYINPVNIQQEKRRFLANRSRYNPAFKYKPLDIDPYKFRESLYRLPVDKIRDPDIQQMYGQTIDMLSSKIDLLVNAGNSEFKYCSLKYYGEPSLEDEDNARFLLHAAENTVDQNEYSLDDAIEYFKSWAAQNDMPCRIETTTKIAAKAMVSNSRKTLYLNKSIPFFREIELKALANHELGVHMATTLNSAAQPLKIFSLGLPGNTMTQEGLAILNEWHSGCLDLARLKGLALRVLAVKEMLAYGSFSHTYNFLVEEMKVSDDEAFSLAVRVHRSGGFTKDYLYLRGFSSAVKLSEQQDISNLYVGKTSFNYLKTINELVERKIVNKPRYVPQTLIKPERTSDILNYLVKSIKPTVPEFQKIA